MDLEKIQRKLAEINQRGTKTEKTERTPSEYSLVRWKPTAGETEIRILENLHYPSVPIATLGFYYFNNKTYLAPANNGNPDPVLETYENFMPKTQLPKDEWVALAKQRNAFELKLRHFAYILVRGKEHEGVKIWEFGKLVNEKLQNIMNNTRAYGKITDFKNGRDIVVIYKPAEKDGALPSTDVMPMGFPTPVTDDPEILAKIKEMPRLDKFFKEASYDELKAAVDQHFASLQTPSTPNTVAAPVKTETSKPALDDDDSFNVYTAPTVTTMSNPDAVAAVDAEFAALLDGLKL